MSLCDREIFYVCLKGCEVAASTNDGRTSVQARSILFHTCLADDDTTWHIRSFSASSQRLKTKSTRTSSSIADL